MVMEGCCGRPVFRTRYDISGQEPDAEPPEDFGDRVAEAILAMPGKWRALIRRVKKRVEMKRTSDYEHVQWERMATGDANGAQNKSRSRDDEKATSQLRLKCHKRDHSSDGVRALLMHMYRVHGSVSYMRRQISGSTCAVCSAEFHRRHRLLGHFSTVPRCSRMLTKAGAAFTAEEAEEEDRKIKRGRTTERDLAFRRLTKKAART